MSRYYGHQKPKQKKGKLQKQLQYPEPRRKSLFNVVCDNMKFFGRHSYVHRLIYIGEHTFPSSPLDSINVHFKNVITLVNSSYCEEYLTGYLLYYPRYFCHVLEGSEEVIHRHLQLLNSNVNISKNLSRLKILVAIHHINQRFLTTWTEVTAKPPTLLEKIDPHSDLEATIAKIVNCVAKLYRLGMNLRIQESNEATPVHLSSTYFVPQGLDSIKPDESAPRSRNMLSRRSLSQVVSTISDFQMVGHKPDTLPEYHLIEFLLSSPYIQDLSSYANLYGKIPFIRTYLEVAWPVSVDYVPRNIFDVHTDEVTETGSSQENISVLLS